MEAEEAIKHAIQLNPDMIKNRTEALELIFALIGGGLDWVDGEIQDVIQDNYLNRSLDDIGWYSPKDKFAKEALSASINPDLEPLALSFRSFYEGWSKICAAHNAQIQYVLDNVDELCNKTPLPKSFYPLSKSSNISKIPDNVKGDWLDIAEEFCNLVLKTDPEYVDNISGSVNEKNHEWAKKALERIGNVKDKRKVLVSEE